MAKTRIKTTPTRMQKEALMASAAVTTTTNIVTEHVFKKRISVLKNSINNGNKESAKPMSSTIIVQPPKRTNSISSTTSTISHTSEGSHAYDDSPSPHVESAAALNTGPTMDELTENAIKTLNAGLLAKTHALALKNRKVYMITEKCDDTSNLGSSNVTSGGRGGAAGGIGVNGVATGQKRKMYLIMEEKESDKNLGEYNEKLMKPENTNGSKKLTLFTDTSSGQLPQKFEKILPEILNCIQAKKGCNTQASNSRTNDKLETLNAEYQNGHCLRTSPPLQKDVNVKYQMKNENTERLPLTLPPKKNRTKIITTQIIPVNPKQNANYPINGIDNWAATGGSPFSITTQNNNNHKPEKSSAGATPVIVNASTLMAVNKNNNNSSNATNSLVHGGLKSKENSNGGLNSSSSSSSSSSKPTVNQLHKNINLSTDFLFLMKMLPRLESIEEPHKNYVKTCIEDIIHQYAPNHIEEQ